MSKFSIPGLKRDFQQVKALIWRYWITLRRDKKLCISFSWPLFVIFVLYAIFDSTYSPAYLSLSATHESFVTSTTPDATTNYFVDSADFITPLELRNCTILQNFKVGIVKQDQNQSIEGYPVLSETFSELNKAYSSAYNDEFQLESVIFETAEDLETYVEKRNYHEADHALCFALEFQEYTSATDTYSFNVRMNLGWIWSTRMPQYEYEESSYNQEYLVQYGNTGFLQILTTLTSKIISEQYKKTDFDIQLLYMPMNTEEPFQNDDFAEIYGAFIFFSVYIIVSGVQRLQDTLGDPEEQRINRWMQQLGMRKSVELILEFLISLVVVVPFLPLVTLVAVNNVCTTTSFGFMFLALLVYYIRQILQTNILKFFIDSHVIEEVVELTIEAVSILVTFYGYTITKINPVFVYTSSFLLPLPGLQWVIQLGIIASNRNSATILLFQNNYTVNGNNITQVLNISMISLAVLAVISLFLWPVKIQNNPEDPVGVNYLCTKRFWTSCCKPGQEEQEQERQDLTNQSSYNDDAPFLYTSENSVEEASGNREQLEMHGVTVEHYAHSFIDTFKCGCCSSGKHHHNLLDHFSLTVKKGEILVLIGKNGSGKSSILRTIAGQNHVHHGSIRAFGVDLQKSLRYTKNNFLGLASQEGALMSRLTPEEHIRFACKFMGIENEDEKVEEVLREFDLMRCSQIVAEKCSKAQQKSLNLALNLLGESKVVLLDEPTAMSDFQQKRHIWDLIKQKRQGRVIIVATQDMQEANAIGSRIALVEHGKLGMIDTPRELAQKLDLTLQLVFTLRSNRKEEEKSELKELAQSAVMPEYRDQVTSITWNSIDQLIVKLPRGVSHKSLHTCIDMSRLQSAQDRLFETVKVKSTNFDEVFAQMIGESKFQDENSDPIGAEENRAQSEVSNEVSFYDMTRDEYSSTMSSQVLDPDLVQVKKAQWRDALIALLRTEVAIKNCWKHMCAIFLVTFVLIAQETFLLFIFSHYNYPTINYNDYGETFSHTPYTPVGYFNSETSSGDSTETLFNLYKEMNPKVPLEGLSVPVVMGSGPEAILSEAAIFYAEQPSEEGNQVSRLTSSEGEEKVEVLGAYYLYEADYLTNTYSIGIYGGQFAAASSPTYGATMLSTLARQITGENKLKISLQNKLLPINNALFPPYKPAIAEVFSVSILTATMYLVLKQVEWHGKPVNSGFYETFLVQGGSQSGYMISKYLKMVLSNLFMILALCILLYGQSFYLWGSLPNIFAWALVNPVYIIYLSSVLTIFSKQSYKITQRILLSFGVLLFMIAFISAGIFAFSQLQGESFWGLRIVLAHPMTILFETIIAGLLFIRTIQLTNEKTNLLLNPVDLNPFTTDFQNKMTYWLLFDFFYYSFLLVLFYRNTCICKDKSKLRKVVPLEEFEIRNDAPDVKKEAQITQQSIASIGRQTDFQGIIRTGNFGNAPILMVKDLQCWKFIQWNDVGSIMRKNREIVVINKDLLGLFPIKGVSFQVRKSEKLVLLSVNSSGVSTLLRTITCLDPPRKGKIILGDRDISDKWKEYDTMHGVVSYQPRSNNIDGKLTVYQHLFLFAELAGLPKESIPATVRILLKELKLDELSQVKAKTLSQGMARKLTLGMALIGRAQLTVLDNPLEGVDPINRRLMIKAIKKWTDGRALLLGSHDIEAAELIGDRIAVMSRGQFLAIGTATEIIQTHGKGHTLAIQVDLKELRKDGIQTKWDESLFLKDAIDGRFMLKRIVQHLAQSQKECFPQIQSEFAEDGLLESLYKAVDQNGAYKVESFIQDILMLNLALTLIQSLGQLYASFDFNLQSVVHDKIQISIDSDSPEFDLNKLTADVENLTKERGVSFFSINTNSFEQVVNSLVQSKLFSKEKLKKAFNTLYRDTEMVRFTNTINQGDSLLI